MSLKINFRAIYKNQKSVADLIFAVADVVYKHEILVGEQMPGVPSVGGLQRWQRLVALSTNQTLRFAVREVRVDGFRPLAAVEFPLVAVEVGAAAVDDVDAAPWW